MKPSISAASSTTNQETGTFYLGGELRARKPLQRKASRKPKLQSRADLERMADWSGFDGHRMREVFVFDRPLSTRTCEQFGLKRLDGHVYHRTDDIPSDQYHPNAGIAGWAVDVG
jgi:hypothetical protein